MPYERTKRLPVTDLNVALSRQSEGLSDAQAARNLKASVLAQLGNPEPNDIILELSDETYYLDATREWTFSQQAMQVVDNQVVVDTVQYRGERKPGETPKFKDWREWEGEVASGHFYAEDLEQVRRELLAEGHCPKVVMRSMSEWRCLRLRVRGGEDCVICAFHVAAGLDGPAGAPLSRAAPGGRGERGLPSPSQGAPGSARVSAGRARGAGRRASWTTSSPCTSPSPHRPRTSRPCASSATGTKRPWSSPTWNRPGCLRWSSSSTATSRSGSATE